MLKVPGDTSDKVFDWLSDAIIRGEFAPGEKLNEPKIARLLAISRGPVREAVRRLEEKYLVVRTPQQGARVILPSEKALLELFTLREALEGVAAAEAARHIEPDEAVQLRHLLDEPSPSAYAEGGEPRTPDFHIFIAKVSRNEMLFKLLCVDYYKLLMFYRRKYNSIFHRPAHVHLEHRRIAEAIINRDATVAELLMRRHIADARNELLSNMATLRGA
ncbi:GntR family transcriptional regulator [Ancylobacter terrae]|uniref:GntR family transcriptional regulator n=1 Tax=Ancylobacter sp. sgz301288 TaxID=3342077 RepID=UPI00385890F9